MSSEAAGPASGASPVEEVRRLARAAAELKAHPDRARQVESLRAFVAYADQHRRGLLNAAAEVAADLDEAALALYRLSELELAARAVDVGLQLTPGASSLQHRKALVLLAQNRDLDEALALLESALSANPHDKQVWASKGDALKLLGRPSEAAEAYVRAQQLDATSMQYVERALRAVPNHAVALRMKLNLARAHGGDVQALEACNALLLTNPTDPGLLFARAELLSALGQVDAAFEALAKAEEANPSEPKVPLLRGRLLLATGKGPEAVAEFAKLLDGGTPLDAVALGEVAEALERAGEPARAIDARQKLRQLEPRNLGNLTALRVLASAEGKVDVALEACAAILEASPKNLEAMRARADLLAGARRTDEAIEAYRALLETHPRETSEARRAAEFARQVGAPPLVIEFTRHLLNEEPEDLPALRELARAQAELGDREGALTTYDALLQARPSEPEFLAEKKRLLTELGRPEELAGVYDEMFRIDPTRCDVALERGHLYLAKAFDSPEGAPEREQAAREALVSYERASRDAATATKSLLGVARASRLVGDHERAVRAYREFLADPAHAGRADVLKELGHTLREMGRLTEADAVYEQAIQLGLEEPDLFWAESEVLSLLNQEAKALRFVDLLLQREPENPLFLRRKGQLLLKSGRRSEGLQVLKQAVAGASNDPHVHFEVAEALRATGAYTDAIQYYRNGLTADPKHRPGRLALAETLALAGQYNESIPVLDALLREDPNDLGAWRARADAYRRLQRPTDLLYSLRAILLLDPHNGPALLEKYRLHLAAGEKTDAYEALTMLLDSGGPEANDPPLFLEHGDLSADLGHTEEANRSYERAAQLDPAQRSEIATRRARLRLAAGRPDLALEALDAVLSTVEPGAAGTSTALLLRAEILTALERPAEAEKVYRDVLAREPKSPVALAGVGRALLDQGKHAEGKEFLRGAIPQVAPTSELFLLLAEAEAGTSALPDAVRTVQRAVEVLPKAASLWVRLGELQIARESWPEAADAYAHAIALAGAEPSLHLRAGFVAERLGHPNEALALYDRATQVAPSNKAAWTSRGLALLAIGRPEEAQQSFDRALGLDSDYEPAKEGKKAAVQKTREGQVERYGREALLLEARLRRTVTKNDLFVTLHVPFELLEPVLTAIGRPVKIDLARLSEAELRDLETASYHLITTALERRPEGIERRGFTLADVAVLSPATASLDHVQRLFGYLRGVLEADLRPENLRLTPDVEELARRALLLPEGQRTLFQLVRTLKVGLFKARLIKVVESAGAAVHAPLPTLDLGQYSPEFRSAGDAPPSRASGSEYFAPDLVGGPGPEETELEEGDAPAPMATSTEPGALRCVGCGGLASITHACGAAVCQHCIAQFHTCPKCGEGIGPSTARALAGHASGAASPASGPRATPPRTRSAPDEPGASVTAAARAAGRMRAPPPRSAPETVHPGRSPPHAPPRAAPGHASPAHAPAPGHVAPPHLPAKPPLEGEPRSGAPPSEEPSAPEPPRPPRPREKPDDEPRL